MNNNEIDEAILAALKDGVNKFYLLHARIGDHVEYRRIDRRLQALRKQGKIAFDKGCWRMA